MHFLVKLSQQKDLYFSTGFLFIAIHPGRKYLGVIKYQYIAIVKIIDHILEFFMSDLSSGTVNDHHAGVFTVFRWMFCQ